MRLYGLFALVLLTGLCGSALAAAQRSFEEKYPNGKPKSYYALNADGKKNGPYSLYSEDGKPRESGTYKDDQLDGTQQVYFPGGRVKLRREYKAGQLQGALVEFDERGNKVRTAEYRLGQLNGTYREFSAGSIVPGVERVYVDGALLYPRGQALMASTLAKIREAKIETRKLAPNEKPVARHPGGNASQADRENAVRLLMEYRYLCNVPYEGLQLDPYYNAAAEAAVGILDALNTLSHTPDNPGWPEADYEMAKEGCEHSNLYFGRGGCSGSINVYMEDSDARNIARVGHRRWCLNPALGRVGVAASANRSALRIHDSSSKQIPDWDFVAYPAPGYFPTSHFNGNYAWSVVLNELKFGQPLQESVKVHITPVSVELQQGLVKPMGEPLKLNYFNVNLDDFGGGNCIIFRPGSLNLSPGTPYLVEIDGLKDIKDKPAKVRYLVEFCRRM